MPSSRAPLPSSGGSAVGEAAPARALICLAPTLAADLARALTRRGWVPSLQAGPLPSPLKVAAEAACEVLFLELGDLQDEAALVFGDAYRRAGGHAELVIVVGEESAARRRWAAELTPYWYRSPIAAETLAVVADHARARAGWIEPRGGRRQARPVRNLTLRLWESVELDGRVLYLGTAERNFLFTLASREGVRVSKLDAIEAGPGRKVLASECRRRLGRRLGPELTELLIPKMRGEPYRFRAPLQVEAACLAAPSRHPPTRLRLLGRSSVRVSYSDRIEAFASS